MISETTINYSLYGSLIMGVVSIGYSIYMAILNRKQAMMLDEQKATNYLLVQIRDMLEEAREK